MSQNPNSVCTICTKYFENSETLVSTQYHHTFHQNCLNSVLETNPGCPVCKSFINNATLTQFRLSNIHSSQGAIPRKKTSQSKNNTIQTRSTSRLQGVDNNRNLSLPVDNLNQNPLNTNNSTLINSDTPVDNRTVVDTDLRNEITKIYRTIETLSNRLEQLNITRNNEPNFPQDLFPPIHSIPTSFQNIQNSNNNFSNIPDNLNAPATKNLQSKL